jgi:hypothetical protein
VEALISIIAKSDLLEAPPETEFAAAVEVSTMLPVRRPVGAAITEAVMDSPQVRPFVVTVVPVAESTVRSILTRTAAVVVSPPTTVTEV